MKNGVSFGFARGFFPVRSLIQTLGFMHPPAGAVDADNDRMMDHAIHDGGRDYGIAQILAHGLRIDVGRQNGAVFAVTAFFAFPTF